jgi:hypothetical protein
VRLRSDYEEVTRLVEGGMLTGNMGTASTTSGVGKGSGIRYEPPIWAAGHKPFVHRPKQVFDVKTRAKGMFAFWTGSLMFLYLLREFLVGTAGSTWAYNRPDSLNPFWIRRFKGDWDNDLNKDREAKGEKVERAKSLKKEHEDKVGTTRNMDSFYVKRGISNVRRKSSPRGWTRPEKDAPVESPQA